MSGPQDPGTNPRQQTADQIRASVIAEQQRLADAMAPFYLGRKCPLKGGSECDGPHCMFYTPLNDNPEKPNVITGGTCLVPLAVHELTVFNQHLGNTGQLVGNFLLQNSPRIIK